MDVEELVSTVVLLFDSFGFHLTISSNSLKFFPLSNIAFFKYLSLRSCPLHKVVALWILKDLWLSF